MIAFLNSRKNPKAELWALIRPLHSHSGSSRWEGCFELFFGELTHEHISGFSRLQKSALIGTDPA
jgi:hypothetical protein